MAEWSKDKVEPKDINNGREFDPNLDNLTIAELNAIVNNSFYASDKAKIADINASTANTTSEHAKEIAETANTNASNAETIANSANTKSDNAVSTANSANTKSTNAVSTANDALSIMEHLVVDVDNTDANQVGTASLTLVEYTDNGKTYKKLKASNLKGQTGEQGIQGKTGNTGNGISSITKTGTSGLVDTYTISFTNGNSTTFQVSNGRGITKIEKTSTSGLVDTYTITFNNNTTQTFTVTNGAKGDTGAAAGFGTPTVDNSEANNVGTPSVEVTMSGANTAKVFNFKFKNLKGQKGDSGEIYQTTGTSTTGAMSQKAVTDELNNVMADIQLLETNKQSKLVAQQVQANVTRQGQNDTVVKYRFSTDSNAWYRVWASGWIECGIESVGSGTRTTALPIDFTTTTYNVQTTIKGGNTSSSLFCWGKAETKSSVTITGRYTGGNAAENIYVYCCGY